jgi:hypothetical protein
MGSRGTKGCALQAFALAGICMGSRGTRGCALQACAFAGTCMDRRGTTGCALRHMHGHRHRQQGHQGVRPSRMCICRHMHGQQGHHGVRPQASALTQAQAAGAPRGAPFTHMHGHRHGQQGHQGVRPSGMCICRHRHRQQGHQGVRPLGMCMGTATAGAPRGAPFDNAHCHAQLWLGIAGGSTLCANQQ